MSIKFSTEKPTLVNNLVVLDGITRTGKFFLGKIVSGLKNTEFFQHSFILDYIPYMSKLGAISENGAISLLKSVVDQSCYDQSIGRNLNLRFDDRSSIYNSPDHEKYIFRSKSEYNREEVTKYLSNKHQLFPFVCHNNLASAGIMLKAFPNFKLIHIVRHPVDLIHSWLKKDYGKTELKSNLDLFKIGIGPSICGKKWHLPWYAFPIRNDYESLNQTDRIIAIIYTLKKLNSQGFEDLSADNKKKIMFLNYEKLVQNTNQAVDKISKFLGNHRSEFMEKIIERENCPNVVNLEEREKKKQIILSKATNKYARVLERLEKNYIEKENFF